MKSSHSVPVTAIFPEWLTLPRFSPFVAKELHVVFPLMFIGPLLIVLAWYLEKHLAEPYCILAADFLICSAIGAMSFGHDYTYKTLNTTLSLPIPRQKIWETRLIINLIAMLPSLLSGVLLFLNLHDMPMEGAFVVFFLFPLPPLLCGLFLAPDLTLLLRNPYFGMVLTLVVPFFIVLGTEFAITSNFFHTDSPQLEAKLRLLIEPFLFLAAIAAGAFDGRLRFHRLEDMDRHAMPRKKVDSQNIASRASRSGHRQNPFWQLLKKEVMLQRTVLAFGALALVVGWGCRGRAFLQAWIWISVYVSSVLVGAIASADERQSGTAQLQALLPISGLRQWTIKVMTVIIIACLTSIMLALPVQNSGLDGFSPLITLPAIALLCAVVSLYISSLCAHSIKAAMLSFPLCLVLIVLAMVQNQNYQTFRSLHPDAGYNDLVGHWDYYCAFLVILGFFLSLIYFAAANHRHLNPRARTIVFQCVFLTVYLVGAGIVLPFLEFLG